MKLNILISQLHSASLNLAYEKYLLLHHDKNPDEMTLYFYEDVSAVVLGTSLDIKNEVFTRKIHPPVFRRMSGGGSVCHFRGNLNYALFANLQTFSQLFPIHDSYRIIIGCVIQALGDKLPLKLQGLSDISLQQLRFMRKISGNSQARKRGWLMHHGTLLYSTKNLHQIFYYLRPPPKQPDYRDNRTHQDFMARVLPLHQRSQVIQKISRQVAQCFSLQPIFTSLTARGQIGHLRKANVFADSNEKA